MDTLLNEIIANAAAAIIEDEIDRDTMVIRSELSELGYSDDFDEFPPWIETRSHNNTRLRPPTFTVEPKTPLVDTTALSDIKLKIGVKGTGVEQISRMGVTSGVDTASSMGLRLAMGFLILTALIGWAGFSYKKLRNIRMKECAGLGLTKIEGLVLRTVLVFDMMSTIFRKRGCDYDHI